MPPSEERCCLWGGSGRQMTLPAVSSRPVLPVKEERAKGTKVVAAGQSRRSSFRRTTCLRIGGFSRILAGVAGGAFYIALSFTSSRSASPLVCSPWSELSPVHLAMGNPHRDLLPVPLGPALQQHLRGHSSLASTSAGKRKARAQRLPESWMQEGMRSLSELAGFPKGSSAPSLSQVQAGMVSRTIRRYAQAGKPDSSVPPVRAFVALLGAGSGYASSSVDDGVAQGNIAIFRRGAVKLPSTAATTNICDVLPEPWAAGLQDGRCVLREPSDITRICNANSGGVTMDPTFRQGASTLVGA